MHNLLGLSLGLLDLLPRLLLLHLQECNTVGEQFGVIGSLLLVYTRFLERSSDFFWLWVFFAVFIVALAVIVVLLLLLVAIIIAELLLWHLLSLRNWLRLFR